MGRVQEPKLTDKYWKMFRDILRKHGRNATLGDIGRAEGWLKR